MFLPGKGFKMYPESPNEPNSYFGAKAARYLHYVDLLRHLNGGPRRELLAAIDDTMRMAGDAVAAYGLDWPPANPATPEDAYAALRFGNDHAAHGRALEWTRRQLAAEGKPVAAGDHARGAVALRCGLGYTAAALFRGGSPADLPAALSLANRILGDLGSEGRLYSTVDSVAAIALLSEMQAAKVVSGNGVVRVDGRECSARDAALAADVRSVEAVGGAVGVEITRDVEEDWAAFSADIPLRVSLRRGEQAGKKFTVCDGLDLVVRLTEGYRDGDLLWVCLPDALSRVMGGGHVKRSCVDFAGKDEVRIPLAATAITLNFRGRSAPQRFAACVRNMFEEERVGNPGPLEVSVVPSLETCR